MKLAILGEKKSIIGFRALGIDTFGIASKQDIDKAKAELKKSQLAALFITEEIAQNYEEEIKSFEQKTLPAVLIVPGIQKTGKGQQGLKKIVERALGSEIIKI